MKVPFHNPVAIGGVGGSGTRLVAQIVDQLGFFIGNNLNGALDNLYFTLLFKRPAWFRNFPSDTEISEAIRLFRMAMTTGLSGQIGPQEIASIRQIAPQVELAAIPIGVTGEAAEALVGSVKPDLVERIGWGWKEPNTHIFLPQLQDAIAGLKYIHVVRHGLDIACSKNQQQPINWNSHICGMALGINDLSPSQSLDYWIAANRRAIDIGEKQFGDRFLLLNYDNLCRSPREGVTILADFLGVGSTAEDLEKLTALVQPISTGRWKQHGTKMFSNSQLDAVRRLGFDIDD